MFNIRKDNVMMLTRGDSAYFEIGITDGNGKPIELKETDKVYFTVKKSTSDEEVLFQKVGTAVSINPEDTRGLEYGGYVYDIQVTFENGDVDTIIAPEIGYMNTDVPNFIITKEVNFE